MFPQGSTGVPSRCGVTLGQECPPHPGDENAPRMDEPGVRSSSWSRVSPGPDFRPPELNLDQKPLQRGGEGPSLSLHLRMSLVLTTRRLYVCMFGVVGGGQPEVDASRGREDAVT